MVCVPAFVVLIFPADVTDCTLLVPPLFTVTAAFNLSFVTESFWFTVTVFPVGICSSLSLRTFTVTLTVSVEPSG